MADPEPLFLPRHLAIRLLAEAQKAPGGETHGWIGAGADGEPVAVWPAGAMRSTSAGFSELDAAAADAQQRLAAAGQTVWAAYHAHVHGPGPAAPRQLIVSLDTKGVLQLRCWELADDLCVERVLKIR